MTQALRETLEARGLVDGIAWKVKHSRIRSRPGKSPTTPGRGARVQPSSAFATMKRSYGMGRVRYLGQARNACHLQFVAMAMNVKRALVLMRPA